MHGKIISEELKIGRRGLDEINYLDIISDWEWDILIEKWYLEISLNLEATNGGYIPRHSSWYIVVEENYPKGIVKIYPSVRNNSDFTFYHQSNNGTVSKNGLWRMGNLCLDYDVNSQVKNNEKNEPNSAENKLLWYVIRTINWIECANDDNLIGGTDPFELPDFNEDYSSIIAFNEDTISKMQWEDVEVKCGYVEIRTLRKKPSIQYIVSFNDVDNQLVMPVKWGRLLEDSKDYYCSTGIWIMLKTVPVLKFWQAPNTYEELIIVCKKYNYDFQNMLKNYSCNLRDGKKHYLLIGFPIPQMNNGKLDQIHWKAIKLPVLSNGKKTMKGFRNNELGYSIRDKVNILKGKMKLDWVKIENWSSHEIGNRGRLPSTITSMKTLIIGAGAIGSLVSEILTRTGMYNIDIQDFDLLEIGNLSRHTLCIDDIGKYKSDRIIKRSQSFNPHSVGKAINSKFVCSDNQIVDFKKYDLIIDCTGSDEVLSDISKIQFNKKVIFASVSVGFAAKRMYLMLQYTNKVDCREFFNLVSPYLDSEKEDNKDIELPRGGIGCWSPIFPARYDDLLIAVSTFIKVLELFTTQNSKSDLVKIFEQVNDDKGFFTGYIEVI
jgi:molybdopterin/thiamine biosynthesis adenylyltransferase